MLRAEYRIRCDARSLSLTVAHDEIGDMRSIFK